MRAAFADKHRGESSVNQLIFVFKVFKYKFIIILLIKVSNYSSSIFLKVKKFFFFYFNCFKFIETNIGVRSCVRTV